MSLGPEPAVGALRAHPVREASDATLLQTVDAPAEPTTEILVFATVLAALGASSGWSRPGVSTRARSTTPSTGT